MAQQQFPSDYRVAQAQEPLKEGLEEETLLTDTSLDLKFETSVNLLINRDNLDEKILRATIRHALDAIFTSNLVIMPTGDINNALGVEPTFDLFNLTMNWITILLRGLNLKLRMFLRDETGTFGSITSHMLEIRDFLLFTKEILETLSMYTRKCDPTGDLARQDAMCRELLTSDESENIYDTVLKENIGKFVRSPFFFIDPSNAFIGRNENAPDISAFTFSTPSLAVGDCNAILEQVAGVQAAVRPTTLSLWQIPFNQWTDAIGKQVWVFEWLPAQYWKTITYCHEGGAEKVPTIKQYIDTRVIIDRNTLNLWVPFMGIAMGGTTFPAGL